MDGNHGVEQGAHILLAVPRQPAAAQPAGGRGRADPYAALERDGDASEDDTADSDDERHPSGGDSSPERNNQNDRRRRALAEMDDDEDLAEFMSPPRQARPARRAGGEGPAVAAAQKRTDCKWRPVRRPIATWPVASP